MIMFIHVKKHVLVNWSWCYLVYRLYLGDFGISIWELYGCMDASMHSQCILNAIYTTNFFVYFIFDVCLPMTNMIHDDQFFVYFIFDVCLPMTMSYDT